ncbi:CRTAC1 family protein [Maribacter aestuarii]|uniref:CRTAC1 family protein n=1 Tax=Maribacter aestuarii TaxID=1130723 RepID=UPI00248B093E|nr:CRTAC1 family protein [Maribacter aestuarii]
MRSSLVYIFCLFLAFGCNTNREQLFKKLGEDKTGISFSNDLQESDDLNILDYLYFYNGGGVAIGDINSDGLPDIFFSGNQVKNQLYLNKGDFTFEDITEKAGVEGNSSWNTGAIMGDVNADGLLDIYVCAVVGLNGFNGHNELFINQGNGTFNEESAQYGLDFESYSSSAAFLDYDLDGDLDMYLLNHAVHTQESFGKVDLRFERSYETGDKLLRNDNGSFADVSEEAGIYGGINGYGLGIAVSDFNQDGYPDLYIGNDFHEDDYYYLNNGDGTFKESLKNYFGHTSRFSMGSDVADLNHDGFPDLISLDMLADDEKVLKASEGDDNIQIQKLRIGTYGYHYQFTRNMLYLNQPDGKFMETALQSGIAATDWSWSALFGDYDQDGDQDLFVSNGIPKRPNDLDYINFVSSDNIKNKISNTNLVDQDALELMPSGNVGNRVFKGSPELYFQDKSKSWIPQDTIVSGATAYGDLDNDGDLDIVTNNLNTAPTLLENLTNQKNNYLKLKFEKVTNNPFGIGTKVFVYTKGRQQYKEFYAARGFQSSSEPMLHFGFGQGKLLDSIKIIWPDNTFQVIENIETNQTLKLSPSGTKTFDYSSLRKKEKPVFKKVDNNLGINFRHKEDSYTDFNRQKLIPYQISDRGPAVAVGDMNQDGKEDIFFGGSKFIPSQIFIQNDSIFDHTAFKNIEKDSIKENVVAVLADLDNDKNQELVLGSGGADFYNQMNPLTESYYSFKDSVYIAHKFPELYTNASVILPIDYDGDGDLDLFIGSQSVSADFGKLPDSYLLNNTNGDFSLVEQNPFKALGMVTDAIADDVDNDGDDDLIIVGEWMSPKFFRNDKGKFSLFNPLTESSLNGLWQSIASFDIDADGDMDYLLGNWGTNSKFVATKENPLKMYYSDFDNNGATETIVAINRNGKYFPIDGLSELSGQLVSLRKKFTTYSDFAGRPISEIIDRDALSEADVLEVSVLKSGYLRNDKGSFSFIPFNFELQVAPLMDFLIYDFDNDGNEEALVGGNYFGVKPYQGRLDSFPGALIKNENNIKLGNVIGLDFMFKSVRHLNIVNMGKEPYLLATMNNDEAQVYKLNK